MATEAFTLPRAFVWRRIHSLFGLWIVIFLIEHLLTNSQAALLIGENGEGFIRAVNLIKGLPYLPVIEVVLLGVPILFHGALGVRYALEGKMNAISGGKKSPRLAGYARNHAYLWQRLTSWILLIGIIAHVAYMRFYMYPTAVNRGAVEYYFVRVDFDPGLYTVADRLGVELYNEQQVAAARHRVSEQRALLQELEKKAEAARQEPLSYQYDKKENTLLKQYQHLEDREAWLAGLTKRTPSAHQVIASAPDFGTATLLIVRDAFKGVFKSILYTVFVLAAVFHAFNGLWTFMITWGIVLKMRSQSRAVNWCVGIMILIGFLGLASIWGTYFINLRY
ncbi:MAG: succinate dehydrogenase [Chlamydiota bacterium]